MVLQHRMVSVSAPGEATMTSKVAAVADTAITTTLHPAGVPPEMTTREETVTTIRDARAARQAEKAVMTRGGQGLTVTADEAGTRPEARGCAGPSATSPSLHPTAGENNHKTANIRGCTFSTPLLQ